MISDRPTTVQKSWLKTTSPFEAKKKPAKAVTALPKTIPGFVSWTYAFDRATDSAMRASSIYALLQKIKEVVQTF
jgi:hypothetical protein